MYVELSWASRIFECHLSKLHLERGVSMVTKLVVHMNGCPVFAMGRYTHTLRVPYGNLGAFVTLTVAKDAIFDVFKCSQGNKLGDGDRND